MATLHHPSSTGYVLDFSNPISGALDLSRSRQSSEPYYHHHEISVPSFNRGQHTPDHHEDIALSQRLSPNIKEYSKQVSSTCYSAVNSKCEERTSEQIYDEQFSNNFRRENRSPSFYGQDNKEQAESPVNSTSPASPEYAACYPGTEHLNPYILQAAFRQQMILENDKRPSKPESDVTSDAGSDESHQSHFPNYPMVTPGRDGKMPRPFKAYPKDPMSLAAGFTTVDALLDTQSAEKYSVFRKRMLEQICAANGGQATVSNPKMRRTVNTANNMNNNCYNSDDGSLKYDHPSKDNSYTERRKKNNAAAKKSRDRRRIKEDEIAIRAAFLERENIELKFELAAARKQLAQCGISLPPLSK